MEHKMILDFSNISDEDGIKLINAISSKKKLETDDVGYFGDGTYNNLNSKYFELVFNTNTLIDLAKDMGLSYIEEGYSKEEIDEFIDDLNKNGYEDTFEDYLKESKNKFVY
jgi:hypothetical protein